MDTIPQSDHHVIGVKLIGADFTREILRMPSGKWMYQIFDSVTGEGLRGRFNLPTLQDARDQSEKSLARLRSVPCSRCEESFRQADLVSGMCEHCLQISAEEAFSCSKSDVRSNGYSSFIVEGEE